MSRSRTVAALGSALLLAWAAQAQAQVSLQAELAGGLDQVAAGDSIAGWQGRGTGALDAEYAFASERGRVAYAFDVGNYAAAGDWSQWRHALSGRWRADLGSSARLFLVADGEWRRLGDAWAAAGFSGVGAMANAEWLPAATVALRMGFRVDARRFGDLPELDQDELGAFLSLRANLPSRTTLIGEARAGWKAYAGEAEPLSAPVSALAEAGRGIRGGRGMGPGLRPGNSLVGAPATSRLVSGTARLAQSLADRTGLALEVSLRDVSGGVPPLLVTTPPLFFDDGVYDDPFASDSRAVRASLKQLFGQGVALEGRVSWEHKDFVLPAFDSAGLPLPGGDPRQDRVWRSGLDLRLPLAPSRTGPLALNLDVGYAFTRQRSNDAFYNLTSHAVGLALSAAY